MVNWTTESQNLEGTWKNDGNFDLPVPMSGYECTELIYEAEELKSLFSAGDDGLADEFERLTIASRDLLERTSPRDLSLGELDEDLVDEIKIWSFKNEILHALNNGGSNYSSSLESICDCYLDLLKERYEQLMGEPFDEESIEKELIA